MNIKDKKMAFIDLNAEGGKDEILYNYRCSFYVQL